MSIGERLLQLRKLKGLSQEEIADKLNVTRQTVSKWETDQSTPDFDKIVPLCRLYHISTDELLTGNKVGMKGEQSSKENRRKRAMVTAIAVVLYILSIVAIIFFSEVIHSPDLGICVFFLFIAGATAMLIYYNMVYDTTECKPKIVTKEDKMYRRIMAVISTTILIIYLILSFWTMAWHITWILWVIDGLISRIVKLVFEFKGSAVNEEE